MKKLILFLILFFGLLNSQTQQSDISKLVDLTKQQIIDQSSSSTQSFLINSIINNYPSLLILLFALAAFILIIGYFGATFFDLTETKVFIKTEFGQLILTALLAVFLFGIVISIDGLINQTANFLISPCSENIYNPNNNPNIPKQIEYANCYLDSLIKLVDKALEENVKESIEAGRETFKQVGHQVVVGPISYFQSFRPMAFKRLDVEIKTAESQFLSSFLISLIAQKAFLNYVAPIFGIFLLFIGLLFRILFFTRKLGGLLIAIGFGLFLIWPLTYMISWFTFRAGVFSSQNLGDENSLCPKECKILVPVAYNTTLNPNGVYMPSSFLTYEQVSKVLEENTDGKNNFQFLLDKGIQPCFVSDNDPSKVFGKIKVADSENCSEICREIPLNLEACKDAEESCNALPPACKIIRAMGLENYTSYYEPNTKYCSSPSVCSFCPDSCKYELREISYSTSSSIPKDQNNKGMEPRYDTNYAQNCFNHCKDCPAACRYYSKKNDGTPFVLDANSAECKNCNTCFNYRDKNIPICMTYVPLISLGNCQELCGFPFSIKNAPTSNICPIDCRIYFDSTTEKYKDPVFIKFCEEKNGKFTEACNRCPIECKLNASRVIDELSNKIKSSSDSDVVCSLPPTFSNGKLDESINKNCARCDPSCRFFNPSSVVSTQIDSNIDLKSESFIPIFSQFYTKAFVQLNCSYTKSYYLECTPSSSYYSNCNWIGGSDPSKKIPTFSPMEKIYPTVGDNQFCPDFIAKNKSFVLLDTDTGGDPVSFIIVKANQYASHLCTLDKDSETFCSSNYCPSNCFYKSWPNFSVLDNIADPNSKINFGMSNCNFNQTQKNCYNSDSPGYLLMAILNYSNTYYLPKAAEAYPGCFPTFSSTNLGDLSKFACYPILKIPSSQDFSYCGAYIPSTSQNRTMKDGAACPYECRYDKLLNNKGICGDFTLSFTSNNPSHNCEPFCSGLIRTSDVSYCTSEAYSCNQLQAGSYWIRISSIPINKSHTNRLCNESVVAYDSTTYKRGDRDRNGNEYERDWWEDSCTYIERGQTKYISFTLELSYRPYNCIASHKYEGLDDLISLSGYPQYRECGEIDTTKNPDYLFCGSYDINVNGQRVNINALNNICYASYNARAMPGLAYHSVGGEKGDFSTRTNNQIKQKILYSDNCQQCPVVFRIKGLSDSFILKVPGVLTNLLNCRTCNIKIDPPSSSLCSFNSQQALGCPLRCRLNLNNKEIPYGCNPDTEDEEEKKDLISGVGYACDDYHALNCRLNINEQLCDSCAEYCEADCQAIPYVRRDCSSCNPAASFGANSLLDAATSQGGLFTQPGWIRTGLLLIPSIILPSFSIVILVSFIKSFSQFLGGDIEIPGIYKLI